jgi:hypothetical protein
LPLELDPPELDPLAVDPPAVDAPAEAPDALVDEPDDEHAAVTPSSNAAAAPAAGTDKDRFIPAPSREFRVRLPVPRMAQGAPLISGRGPGLLTSRRLACSASGNLAETFELMVRQSCHRCQEDRLLFFNW